MNQVRKISALGVRRPGSLPSSIHGSTVNKTLGKFPLREETSVSSSENWTLESLPHSLGL